MTKTISTIFLFSMLILGFSGNYKASAQTEILPSGCSSSAGYSTTTGVPCSSSVVEQTSTVIPTFPTGCSSALGYSIITGSPCNGSSTATIGPLSGCTTALGYSITTGNPCSGSSTALNYLAGCSSLAGYSIFTGAPCNGTTIAQSSGGIPTTPGLPTTGPNSNSTLNTLLLLVSGILVAIGLDYIIRKPGLITQ